MSSNKTQIQSNNNRLNTLIATIESLPDRKATQIKTVTPSNVDQVITADDGKELTSVIIKGDTNLKAENIMSGKSVFNIEGTAKGEGQYVWEKRLIQTPSIYSFITAPNADAFPESGIVGAFRYRKTGNAVKIDSNYILTDLSLKTKTNIKMTTPAPMYFIYTWLTEYNGEIHCVGSNSTSKGHYKYNDTTDTWTQVSTTFPTTGVRSQSGYASFELNGKLYIHYANFLYVWDGSVWSSLTMTYTPHTVAVYKGKVYTIGSTTSTYSTFISEVDLSTGTLVKVATNAGTTDAYSTAVEYDGKLYISYNYGKYLYAWDGGTTATIVINGVAISPSPSAQLRLVNRTDGLYLYENCNTNYNWGYKLTNGVWVQDSLRLPTPACNIIQRANGQVFMLASAGTSAYDYAKNAFILNNTTYELA